MIRRYELTDEDWEQIRDLLPPEAPGGRGRKRKDNRTMLNGMLWIARSGAAWRDLPERYGPFVFIFFFIIFPLEINFSVLFFVYKKQK